MRNAISWTCLATLVSVVLTVPASSKTVTLTEARKAIERAGPQASDADVALAYPDFELHPDHAPRAWFVTATDNGCLYLVPSEELDPAADAAINVVKWERDHREVRWVGASCQTGEFISGHGTLFSVDTNLRNAGRIRKVYSRETGTMVKGVFNGIVEYRSGTDPEMTNPESSGKGKYFGGCYNPPKRYVLKGALMCQPRLP